MKNRIGIVGGGQLGRMLGFEAKRMGFTVIVIDPTPNSPAGQVVDEQILADFKDGDAIRKLADKVDFLTFEVELANADALNELSKNGVSVNPSPKT
jgi:5-(carboxyamino)imidazole ribonucleotide synthase